MYNIAEILLIWLLCLLSVFLHESGHAAGYRIAAGNVRWKIIAGSGPVMIRTAKYIFRCIPAGGHFIPEKDPGTDKGKIIMLAGGPFVSLVLAVLFAIINRCIFAFLTDSSLYEILLRLSAFLLYFNFFQFFFTVIPVRYRVVCRGYESDGLQIINVIRNRQKKT